MVTSMYSKVLQCGNLGVEKALFQAIFRAYNSRGKVFVPYPSSLHIVALQAHFANLIIISSRLIFSLISASDVEKQSRRKAWTQKVYKNVRQRSSNSNPVLV